ncbi:peptidylprolyl isomerase [Sphingomonas sp. KR1UV-12]|uniref:peptidylprolyl isomerase n=1 Tax=Sphingomonas aurea TaxID=3063994 RepID=A0ABT9EJL4_9SPHN|nr:peptidylprolyl isomerase [Sphingomonas sp. KR1UV-12]MDP1027126.1 peptidylprolyl isomerase [Sphingomonas sp. KR1UV-12]
MLKLALVLLAIAAAQEPVPSPTPTPTPTISATPRAGTVRVTIATAEGPILVELERDKAPVTVANFLRYVDAKRFDGTNFYRAMKLGESAGLVQGGVRNQTKLIFPPIAHEPTTKTGLTHDDGAISLARAEPGSGRGDFFIVVGSVPTLDANPAATGDKLGYAVFGHVLSGMDVVRRILAAPTSPTAGGAAMRGQILSAPVRITSVRRVR